MTNHAYILDLTDKVNSLTRNSECAYGGERITIGIANPGDPEKLITGVDISVTPYIPRQDLGENKYFDPITIEEDFDTTTGHPLDLSVTVIPEYSYLIRGSFKTRFGSLTPSESISSAGEFERMMDKVGCNIKNDFYFQNNTPVTPSPPHQDSSIDCARACYNSSHCIDGWSYQIATGKCQFYDDIPIETLQPSHKLHEYEYIPRFSIHNVPLRTL